MRALSTTSRGWHHLASSIPELWSCINLMVNYQEVITHSHLSAIYTFLKLSRDRLLSLKLEILVHPPPLPYPTRILITATLHLLQKFQRWRSISYKTTFELPPIPKGVVAVFLEHIEINFYLGNELQAAKYRTSLVAAAPNLAIESDYDVPANMAWAQAQLIRPSRITGPVVLAEFGHLSPVTTSMADNFWWIQKMVKKGF